MRRRLIVLAVVALLALGVAVAVWAGSDSGAKPETCAKTITVEDSASPRMMEYRRDDCDDDFAVPEGG